MNKFYKVIKNNKMILWLILLCAFFLPIQYLLKIGTETYLNKGTLNTDAIGRIKVLENNLVYFYIGFSFIALCIIMLKKEVFSLFNKITTVKLRTIIIFAIIIRILWLIIFPTGPVSDFKEYNRLALEFAETNTFSYPAIPYLPVGSIFTFAVIYKIFGNCLICIKIIQLILSVFTIFIFYKIADRLFGRDTAKIFIVLYSFYPAHISMINITSPEVMMTFLFGSFIFLFLYLKDKWYKNILLGICAGLLLYVKPIFIFSLFVPFFYNLINKKYIDMLKNLLIPIIAFLLILPFCVSYGHIFLVDTNGGINLLAGNNVKATGSYFSTSKIEELKKTDLHNMSTFEKDELFKNLSMHFIVKNPLKFIILIPKRIFFLLFKDTSALTLSFTEISVSNTIKWILYIFNLIYYYIIMITMLCCIRWKYIKKHFQQFLILTGYTLSVLVIFMVSIGMDRYKYPIMPLIIILSSYYILQLLKKEKVTDISK